MSTGPVPVLWICGPPGVGKTSVGWHIYSQLTHSGIASSFIDIDQLGMCYPEPADDPDRHKMKARNLRAVLPGFRQQGARCVVVSGVVDPSRGVDHDQFSGIALTLCRLRADSEELTLRFVGRSENLEGVDSVLREADELDASSFADVCIETSGRGVAEVAGQVLSRCGRWPALGDEVQRCHPADSGASSAEADGPILILCGPTSVGKSTAGFEVYLRDLRAGLTAAYIDLDQVGFCQPARSDDPGNHRLKARNLAALWRNFRAAGAERLVAVGPVEDDRTASIYASALPLADITLCRLHASPAELKRRVMRRGEGGSWPQPGDPLIGQPPEYLSQIAAQAIANAAEMERDALGAFCVSTDGLTVEESADMIDARTGWHARARGSKTPDPR